MSNSILQKQKPLSGIIASQMVMNPKMGKAKNIGLAFSLNLTALIDAFAILVIFLLSNYNADSQNLDMNAKTQLPTASYSEILNLGTVVKIENGIYNVDDKPNNLNSLVQALIDAKTAKKDQPSEIQESLIILADRQMDFDILSPVIRAGGQAGYSSYKFAVMPNLKTAQRK